MAYAMERVTRIRTRMTSLEGIRTPIRADSDAPSGLTACTARHRHWLWLRARKGPGAGLLFDLLRVVATSSSRGTSDGHRSLRVTRRVAAPSRCRRGN
jgi:hypothetical protein